MEPKTRQTCRGCRVELTLLNRAIDMEGYCGKCAASSQADGELGDLPADLSIEELVNAPLGNRRGNGTHIGA